MATCTEFKNNDFPTDEDLSVSCGEANVSAGPVSLSNGASMNLSNTGSFNLQDLSTTDGGNITISVGGDLTLNNVTCGADLTLVASGILTLNGALNVKGKISMQSGGDFMVNQTISQEEGEFTIQSGGELMINQSITQQEAGTPGPIDISATGKITVTGPITGEKDVFIESTGDMLQIDSTVEGKGEISLQAPSSEVNVTQNITQQDGDDLGTLRISASGKVTIEGTVTGKKNMLIESTGDEVVINDMIIYDGDTGDEDLIEIKTANNDITVTEQINAGGAFLRFTANQGKIDVSADILAPNNHAVFVADKEIALANVDVSGNAEVGQDLAGSIQIMPFKNGGAATQFTIGGSGHTNGVNGKLFARTATGGLSDPERWSGGVLVFNKGNGGIKLDKTTDIVVRATSSKNGVIVLDADEGSIDIPEGTLSVNGQSGNSAGLITLIGQDINFPDSGKTILSASDTVSSGGLQHTIALSAENINYSSAQGLDLRANGAGDMTWVSAVALFPKGGLKAIIEVDGSGFKYTVEPQNNFDGTDAPLNVTGAGPLTITSNGSNSQVRVTGNPVTFDIQGDVSIVSNGQSNTNVTFSYTGPSSPGAQGLILSGPGSYEFLSNGMSGGNGGSVLFSMPSIEFNPAGGVVCRASGEGAGMGGNVIVNASNGNVSKDEQITLELIANGGGSGGQGGLVAINATLDINLKDVTCRANGAGSGNGGAVTINGTQLVVLDKANIVSQAGTDGNGGSININSRTIRINDNTEEGGDTTLIRCMGGSNTGDGGILNIISQDVLSVGNEVNIFASPQGTGNGGPINLSSINLGVELYGENVIVQSKGSGAGGNGGDITIQGHSSDGDLTINASLVALADTEGDGGSITINGSSVNILDKPITVVGGTTTGNGGIVELTSNYLNAELALVIQANARGDGEGGEINLTLNGNEETIFAQNSSLNVSGGETSGKAGIINIDTQGMLRVEQDAILNANGRAATGSEGGNITVTTQDILTLKGKFVANSSKEGFFGGTIQVNAPTIDFTDAEVRANGDVGSIEFIGNGPGNFNFSKVSSDPEKGVIAANNTAAGGVVAVSGLSVRGLVAEEAQSQIRIEPSGNLTVGAEFAIRANGTGVDSNAGTITILTPQTAEIAGTLSVNGNGSGDGGVLTIDSDRLNLASSRLSSNSGLSGGNGGTINISTKEPNLNIDSVLAKSAVLPGRGSVQILNTDSALAQFQVTILGNINTSISTGERGNGFLSIQKLGPEISDTPAVLLGISNLVTEFKTMLNIEDVKGITVELDANVIVPVFKINDTSNNLTGPGSFLQGNSAEAGFEIVDGGSFSGLFADLAVSAPIFINNGLVRSRSLFVAAQDEDPDGDLVFINNGTIETVNDSENSDGNISIQAPSDTGSVTLLGSGTISCKNVTVLAGRLLVENQSRWNLDASPNNVFILGTLELASASSSLTLGLRTGVTGQYKVTLNVNTIANNGLIDFSNGIVELRSPISFITPFEEVIVVGTGTIKLVELKLDLITGLDFSQSRLENSLGHNVRCYGNVPLGDGTGNCKFSIDNGINLGDLILSGGDLDIRTLGETRILAAAAVRALFGSVLLSSDESITFEVGSTMSSVGNIVVSIGPTIESAPGVALDSSLADIDDSGGTINWGLGGISASAPGDPPNKNSVSVLNNRSITFDADQIPSKISLNGGVTIEAA